MVGLPGLSRLPGLFLELMGTGILLIWGVPLEPLREAEGIDEGGSWTGGASSKAGGGRGQASRAASAALATVSLLKEHEGSARALGLISLMVFSSCLMVCSRLSNVL